MKTTTSISMSELGLHLLSLMMERFGINRSSVLEMIIRDYAERHGFHDINKKPADEQIR